MDLQDRIKGRTIVIGVGNTLRGDDGFGPLLVQQLEGKVKADLLDAGEVPESYLGRIIDSKPDTIIVADAVDMQEDPGTVAFLEINEVANVSWSTHRLSLSLFMKYVQEQTGSNVFLVGVQPGTTVFGERITLPMEETLQALVGHFTVWLGN
jgi:hydrogenase 3 maturation protease